MLLKLVLLLSVISAISPEVVEIECFFNGEYCRVEELPKELPANATWKLLCPQDCTQIRMENAPFPRFPRELWNTHKQVTYLYLTGTDFEELAIGDFFNAAKLTKFELLNNKKSMPLRDNCFWGAFELNSLGLYRNKISEMEGGSFNGISRLSQLNMQYNEISHISNDHFRNLPNLSYLYLYSNTIGSIDSEAFFHNTNLDHLNLNSNNLKEVDLLLPLINTATISIYENQITKFSIRTTLPGSEELNKGVLLYLDNNELTGLYIQPNFPVEQLILWANPIQRIDTLPVLRSLMLLNLQWCELKSLDGQRFAERFVNLKTLHMTRNNMISFSKETFAGLDKLETLTLTFNELTEVDFPRLESLTTLDLRNNSLTDFPYGEDIRDTFPSLKDLDIRNNDFGEDHLAELVKTIEDQGITVRWEPWP